MKKFAKLCAIILVLFAVLTVSALAAEVLYSGTCGDEGDGSNLTWTFDDEGTLRIDGNGRMKDYGYGQRSPWYNYRSSVKSAVIGEGVTSIGDSAFSGCSSLTSVVIPEGVTSISWRAFYGCGCLTSVTIPESVTSIGGSAFCGCSSLTSVTIPSSVTSIGEWAFSGCSSLTSVTIPEGVTSIGKYAFYDCSSLTSVIIPSSVTSIGQNAFSNCSSLTSVTIPEGVTSIGNSAFSGCSSLTSVIIPEGLTSIGYMLFSGCRSLTSVTIPSSVTSIGSSAFEYCNNLKDIYYPGTEEEWKNISIGKYNYPLTDATIHYNATVLTPSVTRTADGVVYKVSAANLPVSSVVVVALYKDGRFVGYECAVYNGETLEIAADTPHDSATILAWSNLEKLIPLVPGTKIGS